MFYWEGALVDLSWNFGNMETIIEKMNMTSDIQQNIRKKNIMESLLRHDWAYRWEIVLDLAGLAAHPGLSDRKRTLSKLANISEKETVFET